MDREAHGFAAWCGRLLLLAVLLFGVITMHTFGHAEHLPPTPAAHSVATSTATHSGSFTTQLSAAEAAAPDARQGAGDHDGPPMDPLSVCLAVLGLGATAMALLLGPETDSRRSSPALVRAGRVSARRPNPPLAGRLLLHRLSVLRV